jgi:hypothetical protein
MADKPMGPDEPDPKAQKAAPVAVPADPARAPMSVAEAVSAAGAAAASVPTVPAAATATAAPSLPSLPSVPVVPAPAAAVAPAPPSAVTPVPGKIEIRAVRIGAASAPKTEAVTETRPAPPAVAPAIAAPAPASVPPIAKPSAAEPSPEQPVRGALREPLARPADLTSPLPAPQRPAPSAAPKPPPAAAPAPARVEPAPTPSPPTHYGAGTLRGIVLSFLLLLLLPFFGSLPVMLFQRLNHGLLDDTPALVLVAIAFAAVMALIVSHLLYSIRARVDIGEKAVSFTLPRRTGVMPMLRYRTAEIPYDRIQAVELRREIYGGALAPVLMQGARIVTREDEKIPLGYVNEANVDQIFPYPEIARQIADRAGVPLLDRGSVRRSPRKKMLGIMASEEENRPISEPEIVRLNTRHRRFMYGLVAVMTLLVAIGIVGDLTQSDMSLGERGASVDASQPPPPRVKR